MNESIREQLKRLNRTVSRVDLPDEVRNDVYSDISDAIAAINQHQREGAFSQFIAGYVAREHRKKHRGEREQPLTTDSDPLSPLSLGELPPQLRTESYNHFDITSARTRAVRYVEENPGAIVLIEAIQAFDREMATIERKLREAQATVNAYRTSSYDAPEAV
jgi:hypothetical protein